jgi:hypothetical protein
VRVTHPFHPQSGRQLVCVGERFNRYGMRLLLRIDEETVCSVPPAWTDLEAPDPEIVMGGGRALLRFADALALAHLVGRNRRGDAPTEVGECKDKSAATVRRKMPLPGPGDR